MSEQIREEILKTPINQLGLAVNDSPLEGAVKHLYKELEELNIQFRPLVYLSDDWGCPDNVPAIGIPFYLAHPALKEYEEERTGEIESENEIAQILRHEAGHAFNYAHELHKLPEWQEMFGVFDKPYEDNFAPIVGSAKFVRHLEGWYAQKHPDEDFAETFAVLMTPNLDWRTVYKGTRAFRKLTYAMRLIKEYGPKPGMAVEGALDVPIESIGLTLEEWYNQRLSQQKSKGKVLILFYQEYPQRKPTHDEVVDHIKETLLKLNYSVALLPINQSIERIINGVKNEKPDIVFNLCETFRNNDRFEFNVTALLEMLHVPFTGSSPGSLYLTNDKHLTKKVLDFHRIPYPKFFTVMIGEKPEVPKELNFPLFVKPVREDTSIGIDNDSVVFNQEALERKVSKIHTELGDHVLVEEYIEGREFYVSILGNEVLRTLEIVELDFGNWPEDKHKIYSYAAKIEEESPEFKLIDFKVPPEDLTADMRAKIYNTAVEAYRALDVHDYARIDLRMNAEGKLYVLEANLNPYLSREDIMMMAAEAVGLNYEEFIDKIMEAAFTRIKKNKK